MITYMEQIKTYLAERTPDYGYPDAHSLLEHIWCSYTQSNPVENEKIKEMFQELESVLEVLPSEQSEMVFDQLTDICAEYEHSAFLEGLHVGVRLSVELLHGIGDNRI